MNRNLFEKYILLNQSLYTLSEKTKSKNRRLCKNAVNF